MKVFNHLLLLVFLFVFVQTSFAQDIIEIRTKEDLSAFRDRVNNGEQTLSAKVMADIRITGNWVGIGSYTSEYKGNFDGGGFTINGLSHSGVALFDVLGDGANITYVKISSAKITGDNSIGILANIVKSGAVISHVLIEKSEIIGKASVGGVVGVLHGKIFNTSIHSTSVTGETQVGGIAGNMTGIIEKSGVYGNSYVHGKQYVGGIVGNVMKGSIIACSFNIDTGLGNTIKGETFVGGIAGSNGGLIAASLIRNHNIEGGNEYFGGIAGLNNSIDGSAKIIGNIIETGIEKRGNTKNLVVGLATPNSVDGNYFIRAFDFQNEAQDGSKIVDMLSLDILLEINNTLASNNIAYEFDIEGVTRKTSDEQLATKQEELHPTHMDIVTLEDLMKFATQVNTGNTALSAKLLDDISLEGVNWIPIGTEEHAYNGVFDGNGKVISNLTIKGYGKNIGFFGVVGGVAKHQTVIKDLNVVNVNLYGMISVGGIVGNAQYNTLIDNVTTSGIVMGERGIAGVAGSARGTEIRYAKNYANVEAKQTSKNYIGGIVGFAEDTKIYASYNAGKITGDTNGICATGGIVGYMDTSSERAKANDYSYIMASINEGNIMSDIYVGGIAGDVMTGHVIGNVNFGSVRGYERDIGGIVGQSQGNLTLEANLNFGSVSGGSGEKNRIGVIHKSTRGENYYVSFNGATSYGNDNKNSYYWLDNMDDVYSVIPKLNERIKKYGDFKYDLPLYKGFAPRVNVIDYLPVATEREVSVVMSNFLIHTEADLITLKELIEGGITKINATLANDITLTKVWKPIGNEQHSYEGSFYGAGYSINGLVIKEKSNNVGLFSTLKGTVSNLIIKSPNVEGIDNVGALAGSAMIGSVENVTIDGGTIKGRENVGGIVGISHIYIYHSTNSSNVSGNDVIGGIVGSGITIKSSQNTGKVTGDNIVGGLAGVINDYIDASYNSGKIEAKQTAGGLVGILGNAIIVRSYNLGDVTASETQAGGVAGIAIDENNSYNIWGVYSTGQVIANSEAGGIVGQLLLNLDDYDNSTPYFDGVYYLYPTDIGDNYSGITRVKSEKELIEKIDSMNIAANKMHQYNDMYDINMSVYFAKANNADILTPILTEESESDGEEEGEYIYYEIHNEQDLIDFKSEFEQLSDINFYEVALMDNITLTKPWEPINAAFDGYFDGNGKTISGLVIKSTSDYVGLFKLLRYDATISNITFKSPMIEGGNGVGVVAGGVEDSGKQTINNVTIEGGEIKGKSNVSAFVGENSDTLEIKDSNFSTKITVIK